jgi:hypothetical protein
MLWLWNMAFLLLLILFAEWSSSIIVAVAFSPSIRILSLTSSPRWPHTTTNKADKIQFVREVFVHNKNSNNKNHVDDEKDDNNIDIDVDMDIDIDDRTINHHNDNLDGNLHQQQQSFNIEDNDALLEYSIDSFLRGDYYSHYYYDRPLVLQDDDDDEDYYNAVAPLPGLSPGATVEQALQVLRKTTTNTLKDDYYDPSHAASCFLRFCVPLRRRERWSPPPPTSSSSLSSNKNGHTRKADAAWKELLRGSLTPSMFVRRLRASPEFTSLLDWDKLDVTEGAITGKEDFALEDTVAFVSVAFYFGNTGDTQKGIHRDKHDTFSREDTAPPPELLQIKLNRVGGVWLIDSIQRIPKSLFQNSVAFSNDEEKSTPLSTKKRK